MVLQFAAPYPRTSTICDPVVGNPVNVGKLDILARMLANMPFMSDCFI
jgi:hypothetical protein